MYDKPIKTIEELLIAVKNLSQAHEPYKSELLLFRGQDVDKPLVPKLGRPGWRLTLDESTSMYHLTHLREKAMIDDFIRYASPVLTGYRPASYFEWLMIAQHYGLYTRLLDWSTNPLVALYFAVENLANEQDDKQKENVAVVWGWWPGSDDRLQITDEVRKDPFTKSEENPRILIVKPPIEDARIRAQQGYFTFHELPAGVLLGNKMTPLEEKMKGPSIKKFIIDKDSRGQLKRELSKLGINRSTLFPGLDGAAYHINWFNTFDSGEGTNILM